MRFSAAMAASVAALAVAVPALIVGFRGLEDHARAPTPDTTTTRVITGQETKAPVAGDTKIATAPTTETASPPKPVDGAASGPITDKLHAGTSGPVADGVARGMKSPMEGMPIVGGIAAPPVASRDAPAATTPPEPRREKLADGRADIARKLAERSRQTAEAERRSGEDRARSTGPATVTALLPPPSPTPVAPGMIVGGNYGSRFMLDGKVRSAEADLLPRRPDPLPAIEEQNRDKFAGAAPNPVKQTAIDPVSTFSVDVDTASYSIVRRTLMSGRRPPAAAVRVEEMVNYFPYNYPRPTSAETPFQPTVTVFPSPWKPTNQIVHIALKGYELPAAERPRANLVLLVDISGSMGPADRLPLVKNAFRMLLDELKPEDTVAIVTYANGSDVRLMPTKVAEKAKIAAAIDSLVAGGSTAGASGITDAYKVAEANFDKAAVNRILLATDGDWNVGITDPKALQLFVEGKRQTGIFLSILGVGMGNHNDQLMQTLAQNGNGVAAYIDTLNEARKVLVDEASSSLFPIANDVKIQVEFNPTRVAEYRLVGYETRALKREDFNNDRVDAGEVGSGHAVTAIYEITPIGAPAIVDDLRYKKVEPQPAAVPAGPADDRTAELGFLKVRYKLPKMETSRLITTPITSAQVRPTIAEAPVDVRFGTAVAAFGQLLRGEPYIGAFSYDDVIALANGAKGDDPFSYRAELVSLIRLAKSARP